MEQFFKVNQERIRSAVNVSAPLNDGAMVAPFELPVRPIFESLIAIAFLILTSPIYLFCVGLVKLSSRGPIFYTQDRVGKNGQKFKIYKFRSMVIDAELATGPVLSSQNDQRVTTVGRFLRNTHLDELPQIFNIIRGDMSFIGPRPERPVFVQEYMHSVPFYRNRHLCRPGVTGLAQVCLAYDATADDKIELDLAYVRNANNLRLNWIILLLTIKKVFVVRYNH